MDDEVAADDGEALVGPLEADVLGAVGVDHDILDVERLARPESEGVGVPGHVCRGLGYRRVADGGSVLHRMGLRVRRYRHRACGDDTGGDHRGKGKEGTGHDGVFPSLVVGVTTSWDVDAKCSPGDMFLT